jgi:hypothetical protein
MSGKSLAKSTLIFIRENLTSNLIDNLVCT